ncbi:MAG: hypothetical protein ABL899_02250 [Nitrospira sp.]
MKKASLEIPKAIQEIIPTSPAKKGFFGAVKLFADLTLYAAGSDEFREDLRVNGVLSSAQNGNAVRNLLLLTRSCTRMTGFVKENYMERPSIEVTIYNDKTVVAKFLAVFWHGGNIAVVEPLVLWDTHSGEPTLIRVNGGTFRLAP